MRIEVLRGDKPTTVTVSVAERADPLSAATLLTDPRENIVAATRHPCRDARSQARRQLAAAGKAGVVVASASASALDSDNGGLQPGDVIHAVNGQWIADLPALRQAVDSAKPGAPVVLQLERRGGLMYLAFTVE